MEGPYDPTIEESNVFSIIGGFILLSYYVDLLKQITPLNNYLAPNHYEDEIVHASQAHYKELIMSWSVSICGIFFSVLQIFGQSSNLISILQGMCVLSLRKRMFSSPFLETRLDNLILDFSYFMFSPSLLRTYIGITSVFSGYSLFNLSRSILANNYVVESREQQIDSLQYIHAFTDTISHKNVEIQPVMGSHLLKLVSRFKKTSHRNLGSRMRYSIVQGIVLSLPILIILSSLPVVFPFYGLYRSIAGSFLLICAFIFRHNTAFFVSLCISSLSQTETIQLSFASSLGLVVSVSAFFILRFMIENRDVVGFKSVFYPLSLSTIVDSVSCIDQHRNSFYSIGLQILYSLDDLFQTTAPRRDCLRWKRLEMSLDDEQLLPSETSHQHGDGFLFNRLMYQYNQLTLDLGASYPWFSNLLESLIEKPGSIESLLPLTAVETLHSIRIPLAIRSDLFRFFINAEGRISTDFIGHYYPILLHYSLICSMYRTLERNTTEVSTESSNESVSVETVHVKGLKKDSSSITPRPEKQSPHVLEPAPSV